VLNRKFVGSFHPRLLGATLACLTLAGCVGGSQMVKPDYRFKTDEHKGLGIVSVEVSDRCGKEEPVIHYQSVDTDTVRELVLDKESKGKVSAFPQGWFYIQEENPGKFLFTHVSYGKEAKGTISQTPVTFTDGRVTYLGALKVSIPDCGHVNVTVEDKSNRDYPVYEQYMTHFKSNYVLKDVIQGR